MKVYPSARQPLSSGVQAQSETPDEGDAFDPSSLSLTGWWRASYSGSPWVGLASAGSSGGRNLSEATNPPGTGSAVDGFTSVDCDGTNDELSTESSDTFFDQNGQSGVALVMVDAAGSANLPSTPYAENNLMGAANYADWGLSLSSTPALRFWRLHSGAGSYDEIHTTISTGVWLAVFWRYDGSYLNLAVNNVWATPVACASSPLGSTVTRVGTAHSLSAFFNGKFLEIMFSDQVFTDEIFDQIYAYLQDRYPSTGIGAPTISSSNYAQGQIEGGGDEIVLTGTKFTGGVPQVDGTPIDGGSYTVDSDTQITFTLPAHAAGTVNIEVVNSGGTSNTLTFEYWSPAQFTRGLHLRADSTTGYTVASSNGTWLDVSGNGFNASHGSSAPLAGTAVNGNVPPDFDGVASTGNRLDTAVSWNNIVGTDRDKYLTWTLCKRDSGGFTPSSNTSFSSSCAWIDNQGFGAAGLADDGGGKLCAFGYHWDSSSKEALKHTLDYDTWYLILTWIDCSGGASPLHIEVNGSSGDDSASANALGGTGNFVIGRNYQNGIVGHEGPILEVGLTYDSVPSAGERTKLLNYARQRYGLALA